MGPEDIYCAERFPWGRFGSPPAGGSAFGAGACRALRLEGGALPGSTPVPAAASFFARRAAAAARPAFLAFSLRCSGVSIPAEVFPPMLPPIFPPAAP